MDAQEVKAWFKELDLTWKRIFKQEMDINRTPKAEELAELLNLEEIDVSGSRILSLEPLQPFTKLKKLDFSNTKVKKVTKLRPLKKLEYINASKTQLTDITTLKRLRALNFLDISDTKVQEVDPVFFENVETFLFKNTPIKSPLVEEEEPIEVADPQFREAAILVINAQQCSASFLQRKLKLGYNRAGRLVDQLEAQGIVSVDSSSRECTLLATSINELNPLLVAAGYEPEIPPSLPDPPAKKETSPEPENQEGKKGFWKRLFGG